MAEEVTVVGHKTPAVGDITVYIDKKIVTRFESFSISHSLDIVPISFTLQYGLSEGVKDNPLQISKKKLLKTDKEGIFPVGKVVKIYLEKELVLTGYIDSTTESYSHGQHVLSIDGRSKTSVIVDSSTDKPAGYIPTSLTTLEDVANYMFNGYSIKAKDLSKNKTPRNPLASYCQIDLTTKPYDYISMLSQYEGKLLYDDEKGNIIINDPADKSTKISLTDTNSKFEEIMVHRTALGRYQNYRYIIDPYNGPAGWNSQVPGVEASDPDSNDLPPKKNITIVSNAAYPQADNNDGLRMFTQDLANYTAATNWGRGKTITAVATGFIDPTTKKIWKINTLVNFDYQKPQITGDYVVQSVTFFIDDYGGRKTELTFLKREALAVQPVTIVPPISGVNPADMDVDKAPDNAKENK